VQPAARVPHGDGLDDLELVVGVGGRLGERLGVPDDGARGGVEAVAREGLVERDAVVEGGVEEVRDRDRVQGDPAARGVSRSS